MDSITYDFRQASPDDSLNNHQPHQQQQQHQQRKQLRQDSYYDSLGEFVDKPRKESNPSPQKKLIIPYHTDSFSSNTSVYSGSRESLAGSDSDVSISSKTAEPDSLTPCMSAVDKGDNLTLEISALKGRNNSVSEDECSKSHLQPPIQIRRQSLNTAVYSVSPPSRITEHWRPDGFQQPYRHHPEVISRPASRTQSPIRVMSQQNNPLVNQSIMRMATERMKRKFLGWN